MEKIITGETINDFREYLISEEKSRATVEKYCRDVRSFAAFSGGGEITKETVIAYKNYLKARGYAASSINSMLASLNSLIDFLDWNEIKVKQIKIQKQIFCTENKKLTKEEYVRLIDTAKKKYNERLSLIIQTMCGTGIRVSELPYITVEAVVNGETHVSCKGKVRTVFIVEKLQKKLLRYIAEHDIKEGSVFVTRGGKQINRSNIWRSMKSLCKQAEVNPEKVFPHNLRHLFASTFYSVDKDIAKLADILGHSSINTTRIYIISTGAEHRKYMENMNLIQ